MFIDKKRIHSLANYCQKKKGKRANLSNHNIIFADFSLKYSKGKDKRICQFNFNKKEDLVAFRKSTTYTKDFTSIFRKEISFMQQLKMWEKKLKKHIYLNFSKVRVAKRKPKIGPQANVLNLQKLRKEARLKNNHEQVEKLENEIKESEIKIHSNLVEQNIKKLKDKSRKGFWKIKNKIFPKDKSKVPIAKQNLKGQIITNHKELKKLYLDHFKFWMRKKL